MIVFIGQKVLERIVLLQRPNKYNMEVATWALRYRSGLPLQTATPKRYLVFHGEKLNMAAVNGYGEGKRRSGIVRYILALICLLSGVVFAGPVAVQVQDPDGVGVEGVAVYIEWLDGKAPVSSSHSAIDILQKDKGFSPFLSVVQSGTTVTFSNFDDITHHIYSVTGNERFSYNIRAGEKTPDMTIEKPGLIAMGCNIHDWMSGYLLVLETPYYALTDSQGRAVFEVREAGNYRAVAWHPQMKDEPSQDISLPGDELVVLKLQHKMAKIPRQKAVDDFDFLEGY